MSSDLHARVKYVALFILRAHGHDYAGDATGCERQSCREALHLFLSECPRLAAVAPKPRPLTPNERARLCLYLSKQPPISNRITA